jgi:hypothetical protein
VEAVHGVARDVDEIADAGGDQLVAEQELGFALDDVERLVLAAVDVRRRAAAGGHDGLHGEVHPAGLGAGHQKPVPVARTDVDAALVGGEVKRLAVGVQDGSDGHVGSSIAGGGGSLWCKVPARLRLRDAEAPRKNP